MYRWIYIDSVCVQKHIITYPVVLYVPETLEFSWRLGYRRKDKARLLGEYYTRKHSRPVVKHLAIVLTDRQQWNREM